MKPKIKPTILEFLKNRDFTASGTICAYVAGICKCKHSNVERRCRELETAELLEHDYFKVAGAKNEVVFYRLKKQPLSRNPQVNSLFRKIINTI